VIAILISALILSSFGTLLLVWPCLLMAAADAPTPSPPELD
jgi:hypothetical protein